LDTNKAKKGQNANGFAGWNTFNYYMDVFIVGV
jgi:hypothetical protein